MCKLTFAFHAVLVVVLLQNAVNAQEKDGIVESAPRLQAVFSDDFSKDTRAEYKVAGDVTWESGRLTLTQGASIAREFNGGSWAKVKLEFDDTGWGAGTEAAELRIWFILNGATNCYVRLLGNPDGDHVIRSIALLDTGEQDGKPFEQVAGKAVLSGPSPGELSLEYRQGLVQVTTPAGVVFAGYLANGKATIDAIRLEVVGSDVSLLSLATAMKRREQRQHTAAEQQQLAKSEALNMDMFKLYQQGKYVEATQIGEQVLEITKGVLGENNPDNAINLRNLGQMYWIMGDYARAEKLYRQVTDIQKPVLGEMHPEYADSVHNLALLYHSMGEFKRAEPLYRKSMEIQKAVLGEMNPTYATNLMNLARLYDKVGDFDRAEDLFKRTLEIRKSVLGVKHPSYASTLNGLAALYYSMGDDARAEPLLKQAIEIRGSVLGEKHPDYAVSLSNLAALYQRMGDYARAEPLFRQAGDIKKSVLGETHPDYANVLNGLGLLYCKMEDFDRAEPLYKQALEINKSVLGEQHPNYALSLNNLAMMYRRMGEYSRAEPLFRLAQEIHRSVLGEEHPDYATSLNNLGLMFYEMGDYAQAKPLYEQANEIENTVLGEQHPSYANSLHNLAALYSAMGEYARARPFSTQAVETIRGNLDTNSLVQSERQQKRNQATNRFCLDLLLVIHLETDAAARDVLKTLWRWKGAVTFRQQAYRQVAANPKLAPNFNALRSVSRQLSAVTGKVPTPPPAEASESARESYEQKRNHWNEQFAALSRRREELEQQIAADSAAFRTLREPLTLKAVQQILAPGTAFVDFLDYNHFTPDPEQGSITYERRYVAVVVRPDREPELQPLGSVASLSEAITTFRRPLSGTAQSSGGSATAAARKLREVLWLPLEKHLSGIETVIISPDTSLGTLPFVALPGRKPNSFLIEDYKLASIPFANLLRSLSNRSEYSEARGLLMVGDVDYDSASPSAAQPIHPELFALASEQGQLGRTRGALTEQWASLSGFRGELNTVKSLHQQRFGSEVAVNVLSGTAATEAALLQRAPEFDTLHLITHGFFSDPGVKSLSQTHGVTATPQEPQAVFNQWMPGLLSGLVMAGANTPSDDPADLNDGILRASEIEASSLQGVDLVVLSACETGLGAVAGGEGLTGLQRAFHIAGARSVIASLWKVEDRATQELMRRFYTNVWVKKQSKIDALRNAQLWMLHHPNELEAMGVQGAATRGGIKDLPRKADKPRTADNNLRTDPFFWAAFQLSGDWR